MITFHLRIIFGLLVFLLIRPDAALAAVLEADMVIYNGKILTADHPDPKLFTVSEAAAIYDGKFVAVGSSSEILKYAGSSTQKIDLQGRMVIPGLVETHDHLYDYSTHLFPKGKPTVGMTDPAVEWPDKASGLANLSNLAIRKKPGEWIVTSTRATAQSGRGDVVLELQEGKVTRFDLDTVAPEHPLVLHWSVKSEALVNTKALQLLLARYPQVQGVYVDSKGEPTGRLAGLAIWVLSYEFFPHVPPQELAPFYKAELEEVAAQGITTFSSRLAPNHLAAFSWLHARGELPLRIGFSLEAANRTVIPEAFVSRLTGLQGGSGNHLWGLGDDKLWMVGLSLSNIDHVPSIAGSCVETPYPREAEHFPLWRHQFYGPHGVCTLTSPDYNDSELLTAAARYGFRVSGMHSGGDRGINTFLELVEKLSQQYPDLPQRRWVIDHCRYVSEEQAQRAKKLGIIFSCGPKYIYNGESADVGAYSVIYGEKVGSDVVVPLRRLIDAGVRTTMQLDEHGFHPFLALEVAVNRKDVTGKVWGPQQRITRAEALYMYTRWAAEYVLRENRLGSIEPKKYADFVVLSKDYLTVPEDEIAMIDPLLTVVGGKIVYSNPEFAAASGLPQEGFRGTPTWWKRGTAEEAERARSRTGRSSEGM
ncbi:MAG: amidohydrolase family protein [Acidobacteria bacterium]|nr:amidohydrolase family protein [Acidobacteriota bacterium]